MSDPLDNEQTEFAATRQRIVAALESTPILSLQVERVLAAVGLDVPATPTGPIWEAFICDRCGHEGEHQALPAVLEHGWTREPDVDEFGDLVLCPACASPTYDPEVRKAKDG